MDIFLSLIEPTMSTKKSTLKNNIFFTTKIRITISFLFFPLFLINKIKGKDMPLDWYPLLQYSELLLL